MTDGQDERGRFTPGNRMWEARSSAGLKPKFANPEDLMAACTEYFEWNHDNPLYESKPMKGEGGKIEIVSMPKMRAMTIAGLCIFLDIGVRTWGDWRKDRPDLSPVIDAVEAIIRTQKFEGASADLLNANIIARDLGLADRSELSGVNGEPIKTENVATDAKEMARRIAFLLAQGIESD